MSDPASYRPEPGTIPTAPGVYRFIDVQGRVIYVGKAKNLRQRLNSYFASLETLHFRTKTMVQTAVKVDWTVVQNELESLQLEDTWIKQFDPRFNIRYRDDKSYPWLAVTWNEEFPRVLVGRGTKHRGWRYFGPFGSAWAIREALDSMLRVFPMRSCSSAIFRNAKSSGRPCLLAHIKKCSAPCVGWVTAEQHRKITADFCSFISGNREAFIKKMKRDMAHAVQNLEFERAAVLRDSWTALEQINEKSAIVLDDNVDADVVALAEDNLEVAVQVFQVRDGRLRVSRSWIADRADDSTAEVLVEQFILQWYDGEKGESFGIPPLILVPFMPPSGNTLSRLLSDERKAKVEIRKPKRGSNLVLLDTATRNAEQALKLHKTKRASDLTTRNKALEDIRNSLGLNQAPLRIEGYDISHLQGNEVVGSMVVFEDGLARKSEYRRFMIKSFEGSNDIAAMTEVLTRRLKRLVEIKSDATTGSVLLDEETGKARKFTYRPSLIVVDGGSPQVSAAKQVLKTFGLDQEIALCGLAKRLEEIWLPDDDFPVILSRNSEGLYLLQRVRDESHRFAIQYHRSRRNKAMVKSVLDQVSGLGKIKRKALLNHFGSLKEIRNASVKEITEVSGFGPALAQAVLDAALCDKHEEVINTATGEVLEI